jgi:hypothetical protein
MLSGQGAVWGECAMQMLPPSTPVLPVVWGGTCIKQTPNQAVCPFFLDGQKPKREPPRHGMPLAEPR